MQKPRSSRRNPIRQRRSAARRLFRPRGERLEARLAPAIGVYNEDFSSDPNPADPGFDQFDTYPVRDIDPNNPGDLTYDDPTTPNTVQPDDMLIGNDLPHQTSGLSGSTGRNGRYVVQNGNPGDPGWGLHAHGHILGITSSAFATPQVTFKVPLPGTPGGLGADEEVSGIGVSAQGFGRVVIIGAVGSVSVELPGNTTWQRIAAYRDDSIGGNAQLGAIVELRIYSTEFVAIDNVTVEISATVPYSPPEANDDIVIVHGEFGSTEVFNPIDNDFDAHGRTLYLLEDLTTQPSRGHVQILKDPFENFRGFTYRANADAMADPTFREDSFTYTIGNTSSAHASATDTATVRLVLNTPPVAFVDRIEVTHGTTGLLIIDAAHGVLDNDFDYDDSDSLTVIAHSQPQHGTVTVMPDGSFQYAPTTPDGRVVPDRFTYTITDGYYQEHSEALILVPNRAPVARNDYIFAEHGQLVLASIDVMANDPGDADHDPLLPPQIDTEPEHGTLSFNADGTLQYVASGNLITNDSFTYRLADPYAAATAAGNLATVHILVPNQLPQAINDEYQVAPGEVLEVAAVNGVLLNDSDPDADQLSVAEVIKPPTHGALTLRPDGSFTYTATLGFAGIDTFGYLATDEIGASRPAIVRLIFSNGAPMGGPDAYVIPTDYEAWYPLGNLLQNDFDPLGRQLTLRSITQYPFGGTLSTVEPGVPLAYSPHPGFEGFETLSYTVTNGVAQSAPITVNILVTDDETYIPHGQSDFYPAQHDQVRQILSSAGLLDNDYLAPTPTDSAPAFEVQVVSPPRFGTLLADSPTDSGAFTYFPNPGFVGHDVFRYRIYNQYFYSPPIEVGIDVLDEAPVAQDDDFLAQSGEVQLGNVRLNDDDPDDLDSQVRAELVLAPEHGRVVLKPNGEFYYQSLTGTDQADRFTYRLFDGALSSNVATVFVNQHAPVAHDNRYDLPRGIRHRGISDPGVLGNDDDPDGQELTAVLVTGPSHATHFRLDSNGRLSYTADPHFVGLDTFTYYATDGTNASEVATVTMDVQNEAPVANNNRYIFPRGITRLGISHPGPMANDNEPDGQEMTAVLVTGPSHATYFRLYSDGLMFYEPDPLFAGLDTFTYYATDGIQDSQIATVTIDVQNQAPVANDNRYSYPDFSDLNVGQPGVLTGDSDPDGDSLTAVLVSGPTHAASFGLNPDGSFHYEADPGFLGNDSFTYVASDGPALSNVATITIEVLPHDGDLDDVPDLVEFFGPNGGDGNGDNIPDYQQAHVTSLPGSGGNYITLEVPQGTFLEDVLALDVASLPPDPGFSHPVGLVRFSVPVAVGGSANISIYYHGVANLTGFDYRKYGPLTPGNPATTQWFSLTGESFSTVVIAGQNVTRVQFTLQDGQRGDATGVDGRIVDPGGPAFASLPLLDRVVINEGHAQRSKVNSISVVFSDLVTILPGAFDVRKIGARNPLQLNIQLNNFAGHTVARLTFKKGTGVSGGSVTDGQYRLTIRGDKVRGHDGRLLDGDADGDEGGNAVDEFFRRFGDTDGDGDVDAADKRVFTSAYGKRSWQPGYLWYLDFNASGRIWGEDFAHFILSQIRHNRRP